MGREMEGNSMTALQRTQKIQRDERAAWGRLQAELKVLFNGKEIRKLVGLISDWAFAKGKADREFSAAVRPTVKEKR